MIVEALQTLFSPRAIVERSDAAFRKFEGLPETNGLLSGTLPGPERIEMNGLKFDVDILGGHKTGLYLDQQRNYQLVAGLANSGQVLDCFSFLGGFGLHCARAGAAHVHCLEQSAEACAAAARHAQLNGLAGPMGVETANVFDWLKARTAVKPHEKVIPVFDAIILDPPSFTRTRAAVPDALARLQGNPPARAQALEDRRHAGHVLLFAPRRCRAFRERHFGGRL